MTLSFFISGTLKVMFFGTFIATCTLIILLLVTCCCWRKQSNANKLMKQNNTSNPHVNNTNVTRLPSPLLLRKFSQKPESDYDQPLENVENSEISYVITIAGNASNYASAEENISDNDGEQRNDVTSIYANELGDNRSPGYVNASFEEDGYQELISTNRNKENPYTSLIKGNTITEQTDL